MTRVKFMNVIRIFCWALVQNYHFRCVIIVYRWILTWVGVWSIYLLITWQMWVWWSRILNVCESLEIIIPRFLTRAESWWSLKMLVWIPTTHPEIIQGQRQHLISTIHYLNSFDIDKEYIIEAEMMCWDWWLVFFMTFSLGFPGLHESFILPLQMA